jgi:SAM-dependent methyltransferase
MVHHTGYEKCAHLYDLFDTKENIEFFLRYASQAKEILDIGAGTGRIAIPLAQKGIKVFCVEPSPAMRREFLKKLGQRRDFSEKITLIAGDAASFDLGRTFPAAFLSGSFDHFLDDQERLSSLTNINKHLDQNSKLVFDLFLESAKDMQLSPAGTVKKNNLEYRRFVGGKHLPDGKKEVLLTFEIYESGKLIERIEERSLVGIIDRDKIHRLLIGTGFEVQREFSNYDFTKFQDEDSLLIVEVVKKNKKTRK